MKKYLKLNNEVLNTYKSTGYIDTEKDKEATRQYFLEEINNKIRFFENLDEKLRYLVEEDYYEKEFLDLYDFEFIKSIYKLAYSYKFRFPSFMSASKFFDGYALKSRDGKEILEKYEDRVAIMSLYLSQGDKELAEKSVKAIMSSYQAATPTMLNSGKKARGELVSCFPYDTKVKTVDGDVNISEVKVGDLVLTHKGHYKKVEGVKKSEYKGSMVKLEVLGHPENIKSTKEHPYLIHRVGKKQNKNPLTTVLKGDGDTCNLKWVSAEDIIPGDMLVHSFEKLKGLDSEINIYDFLSDDVKARVSIDNDGMLYLKTVDSKNNKTKGNCEDLKSNKVKSSVELGEEFGRYLGYYLSEGYIHKNEGKLKGLRFTFNKNYDLIIDDAKYLSDKLFGIKPSFNENNDGSVNVCSWSLILADFIMNITGTGFSKKYINSKLWSLIGKSTAKGLLLGVYRGDGTVNESTTCLDLSNVELIKQMQVLAFNIGVLTYRFDYVSNSGTPTSRLSIPYNNIDNIEFIKEIKKGTMQSKYTLTSIRSNWLDGYAMYKVNNVIKEEDELIVYNLEVEDDHTYSANEMIVHNCFKIGFTDDMNSIADNIGNALQLSKLGGGVGNNLTDIRPLGDPIKGILNRASGVMPVCKLLENSFSYANQMGQRAGSGVVYINIFHGDIEEFISAKKPNADEKIRLATLSTGVIIPSIFFELMKKDKDFVLFSPYDIKKEYDKTMSEISITDMYYELLDNPNIRKLKRLNARKIYTEIKKSQFESGYPFEIFDDNVNDNHSLKGIGRVKMSNLCTEILELQEPSVIRDGEENNEYGLDVSCNLGSLDINNSTKYEDFEELVDTSMRLLTQVSNMTNIKQVPSVEKANRLMHSVGLGLMNYHGHLIDNGIEYGSKESIEFIDLYTEAVNYYSLKTSSDLAFESGETFYKYELSDYATGEYFKDYITKEDIEPSEIVKKALGNVPVITKEMWIKLKEKVDKYGVFNSYRLAIAPTGSISYVRSSTASIAPVTEIIETRDYANSRTIYPMPFLTNENKDKYVDAYNTNQYRLVDLYAAAQKHIDQGISMTLYVTDKWTTEELAKLYAYAHHKGIKTVYYVRQRLQTLDGLVEKSIEECESCSV